MRGGNRNQQWSLDHAASCYWWARDCFSRQAASKKTTLQARRAQPTHEAKREQMPAGRSDHHTSLSTRRTRTEHEAKREQKPLGRSKPRRLSFPLLEAGYKQEEHELNTKRSGNRCHWAGIDPAASLDHAASRYWWARDCSASKSEQRETPINVQAHKTQPQRQIRQRQQALGQLRMHGMAMGMKIVRRSRLCPTGYECCRTDNSSPALDYGSIAYRIISEGVREHIFDSQIHFHSLFSPDQLIDLSKNGTVFLRSPWKCAIKFVRAFSCPPHIFRNPGQIYGHMPTSHQITFGRRFRSWKRRDDPVT